MRKEGTVQHFFTVRGRGFDQRQWNAVTALAQGIVTRAKEAGITAKFEADARRLMITSSEEGVSPLVIWRKGEPNIPKEVTTRGKYDTLVQSVLTATKKIAPDIFEMTSPDGRDYRRLLAKKKKKKEKKKDKNTPRIQAITKRNQETKDAEFKKSVDSQQWPSPAYRPGTKAQQFVSFGTLPKPTQTKMREQWETVHGKRFDEQTERTIRELRDSEKATTEAQREKEQAADAAKSGPQKSKSEKSAKIMTEDFLRKAAIRVAAATEDKTLKHALLAALRGEEAAEKVGAKDDEKDDEKKSRHEEGKSVDVGEYLKSKGHDEDAAAWDKHDGDIGSKSASAVVFPEIHQLAWQHVIAFTRKQEDSKTASGSTAQRVALATRLAKEWIQDAIKHPGRVRDYLGVPEGKDIPMGKLDSAITKNKDTGNTSLLSALELAKRLKGMKAA